MVIEIVDFPINSIVIFHSKLLVYQRVNFYHQPWGTFHQTLVFTNKSWDSTKSDRIVHQSTFVGYEATNLIGILPTDQTDVTLKLGLVGFHSHEI